VGASSTVIPKQLKAMIAAGFTTQVSAAWQTTPKPTAGNIELLLREARPIDSFHCGAIVA
jgi:hypothetical protein